MTAEQFLKLAPAQQKDFLLKNVRESHAVVKSLLADQSVAILPRVVSILEALIKYLEIDAAGKP